jgi:hypothetical protein
MSVSKGNIPWNKGKGRRSESRRCVTCDVKFTPVKNTSQAVHCSAKCVGNDRTIEYHTIKCRGCDNEFVTKSSRQKVCSSCANDKSLYARMTRYHLSGEEIRQLFSEHQGKCALCNREARCIDHDHTTKRVRGAVCYVCNLALSRVEDASWLEHALAYLKRVHNEPTS